MKIANSWVEFSGGLLLVIAAIYGIREYAEHKSGVQVEQLERLHDVFDSPAMLERRARAAAQPGRFGKDAYEMFTFFEKVARWEEKGLINVEDLDYYFRDPLLLYWYVWEDAIKDLRRSQQDPELYQGVERVVMRIQDELDVKTPTDAQLGSWLDFEQKRAPQSSEKLDAEKGAAPPESHQPESSEESGAQSGAANPGPAADR